MKHRSDVDYTLKSLLLPDKMPDIEKAAARVVDAIHRDEKIFICGDFDADGATASALCILFFRAIRFEFAEYRVPDRVTFGYGLSRLFVETILEDDPNLLITVDNGVSSVDGVKLANDHNVDVIITDHHLPPSDPTNLPAAHSIVNPYMPGSEFSSGPCGVGVVFYLLARVRSLLAEEGYFDSMDCEPPDMRRWLDLVALGTIVDMAPLDLNNRRLVSEGLRLIRSGQTRPGIRALCEVSGTRLPSLGSQELAFRIGPRINAAGRLDDMAHGIRLLIEEDSDRAYELAEVLHNMNTRRREIQQTMDTRATEMLESSFHQESKPRAEAVAEKSAPPITHRHSVCLMDPKFHEGVVGLIASRLVDRTGLPSVVFAASQNTSNDELKGSARSIRGIHIRDTLALVESRFPKLLLRYGGHAAAAGLTIHKNNLDRFQTVFDKAIADVAIAGAFDGVQYSDGELDDADLTLEFLNEIEAFEPWGQEFELPTFHGTFEVINQKSVGRVGEHRKFVLRADERNLEAIAFNHAEVQSNRITALYQLEKNEYMGYVTLQLRLLRISEIH